MGNSTLKKCLGGVDMNTITRYIAVILISSLILGIPGCSAKVGVSQKRACEAFDKFGAKKLEEADDLVRRVLNNNYECEGGCYYTTDDEDKARLIVENIIVHRDERPDHDYQACTYFVATSEEDDRVAYIYVITFGDKKDAAERFNDTSNSFSNQNNYTSGSTSGIEYAVCNYDLSMQTMSGVYKQGNTVLWITAYAPDTSGLKPYEGIINDMGLVSPPGA